MQYLTLAVLGSMLGACDLILSLEDPTRDAAVEPPDGPPADAAIDAPPAMTVPFGAPSLIAGFDTIFEENGPSLTADQRELYFFNGYNGNGGGELYYATRDTSESGWRGAAKVPRLNTGAIEHRPCISADGLSMYFTRRTSALGDEIFFTTRPDRTGQSWATPIAIKGDVNTPMNEVAGWHSPDGLTLYFSRSGADDTTTDLYVARRESVQDPFISTPLTALNSPRRDIALWSNGDGTTLLFASDRAGGKLGIWEAIRDGAGWHVEPRPELNGAGDNMAPWVSPDGKTVVFTSNRSLGVFRADTNLFIARR